MKQRLLSFAVITVIAAAWVLLASAGAIDANGQAPAGQKTDWETYRSRTYPATVDEHLTDPALVGAVDLHAHSDPDSYPRQSDAFDVARLAKERGLRGLVLKNHYTETASTAYLARKYGTPGIEVFGAVALDITVGGINPQVIRYMVDVVGHYGRIVWMPTHDSEHEITYTKQARPFVAVAKDGKLLPAVLEVLDVIAANDLTLATGHVSADEALLILHEAKKRGVKRMIVTHPLLAPQYTYMTPSQIKESASLGASIEIIARNLTDSPADKTRAIETIRSVGTELAFVSSDAGLPGKPNHTDALAQAAKVLRASGFSEADLNRLFKQNPARLIKLPVQ